MTSDDEIRDRFDVTPTNPAVESVVMQFRNMALDMNKALPEGRAKAIVLTKLEEAARWAMASVSTP
jgi:hypothetical protein